MDGLVPQASCGKASLGWRGNFLPHVVAWGRIKEGVQRSFLSCHPERGRRVAYASGGELSK